MIVSEKDRYIAELMRQDMFRLIGALRPLLLSHGYFADTVDGWIKSIQQELAYMTKKMYVKVSLILFAFPMSVFLMRMG